MSSKKRVLCIGNSNNNFFSIVRYLRDRGYEADLYLTKYESQHFLPENDSFNKEYEAYTRTVSWSHMPTDFVTKSKSEILDEIKGYDIIVGSGVAPAYINKVGKQLDIFIPANSTGREHLYSKLFFLKEKLKNYRKIFKKYSFLINQEQGIRRAKTIILDYTNDKSEKIFKNIRVKGKRVQIATPFLYYPEYTPENIGLHHDKSAHYDRFKGISEKYEFTVFHHCRHLWKPESTKDMQGLVNKGNDKVIVGFKKFIEETKANACLVLFEYSTDVEASKELINRLGIENNIEWFPLMARKEIMTGLSFADVGIGEITHPWIMYGAVAEIIASAKPVIMNRSEDIVEKYDESFPYKQAANEFEVCQALTYYFKNKHVATEHGLESKQWFIKNVINNSVNKLIELIEK